MYSIAEFGWMIRDKVRMDAYSQALRAAIKPGCTVVDLGAGTGIFSLLACQYGAGKVYAIEPNDAIVLARQLAKDNGYADRIEFIQNLSTDVDIGIKADVVIADLRGVLPLYNGNIESMIDARERLLVPGGHLIPRKEVLFAAVFSSEAAYKEIENPWVNNEYNLDLSAGVRLLTNNFSKHKKPDLRLTSTALPWGEIDYRSVSQASLSGKVKLTVNVPGIAHGICIWFDSEIGDGLGFSNSPDKQRLIYGSVQFPWPKPIELAQGDDVVLSIVANKVGADYVWQWETQIFSGLGNSEPIEHFRQSTFAGKLISPRLLARSSESHKPVLSIKGNVEAFILSRMNGENSIRSIAQEVMTRFPGKYGSIQHVLQTITELSFRLGD